VGSCRINVSRVSGCLFLSRFLFSSQIVHRKDIQRCSHLCPQSPCTHKTSGLCPQPLYHIDKSATMGYNISDANSYLVITGGGIEDIKICKKAWVYPWQKHSKISISPFDFEITLQAMTIEKLQFSLPAVFTIGPDDHIDSLVKYAKILTGKSANAAAHEATGRGHVQDIVKGIIEGETRVIVSGMTMEEIFKERQVFKTKVIENVQSELNQFGLRM